MAPAVAIIVPVLNRPHRVGLLIENVAETTERYRLLFVVCEDDADELLELGKLGADYLVVPADRISWACKINDGFAATTEPWVFTGADDLRFHHGWFDRALRWADDDTYVIGTNDIANHRVMTGKHSTHTLFRRDYVERFGTIDQPGLVMHEGYGHDYTDDEAVATAQARGVYVHAFDAIVEHLHPMVGKATDDNTYKAGRKHSAAGRKTFQSRKPLWTDADAVRRGMIPPPERAAVVTATYGDYDAQLHVPVPQDIPTEFICVTDRADLEAPAPWKVVVREPMFPDNPRMSAKVPKMLPDVGCDDVVWIDASHEIVSASFVREALASRQNGFAAYKHPRRNCVYQEIHALLGSENQGGLYLHRPLREQADAYRAEGHRQRAGLFACGVLAWDLREPRTRLLGEAWLAETAKWSHQDQVELPVVLRRLGFEPGVFPLAQIDPKLSRGKPYLANRWARIHPHVKAASPTILESRIVKPDTTTRPARIGRPKLNPRAATGMQLNGPPRTDVSVVIPWRSSDPDRQRALEHVVNVYRDAGYDVHVSPCESEVWSKGEAVREGVRAARYDTLVIADADVLCAALPEAIAQIPPAKWAVPWRQVFRLSAEASEAVYAGADPSEVRRRPGALARRVYGGVPGGGLVVMQRDVYEATPMDPRFLGWGGEDVSWGYALQAVHGPPLRLRGDMIHLWHEPEDRTHDHGQANNRLSERYRQARNSAGAIRRILAELVDVAAVP